MGFDLTNDTGSRIRFSPSGWTLALTLAEHYGWKPAGTTLARSNWSGEYATNEGQRVSESDARGLAQACERALSDPDYLSRISEIKSQIDAAVAELVSDCAPRIVDAKEMTLFRDRLKDLVEFTQGGGFVIE